MIKNEFRQMSDSREKTGNFQMLVLLVAGAILKMITEKHIQSAIIGIWRQGADAEEISKILKQDINHVINVIFLYFSNEKLW